MTKDEQIVVLKSHIQRLKAAETFEDFKAQQIDYVSFLIEQFEMEVVKEESIFNCVIKTEVMP